MSRSARGAYGGASKATATTLCQKCLKRGHYSYECKSVAQERPYISRPSRSQQLLNPSLRPPITNDTPDTAVANKGIADQVLARNAQERRRKRSLDAGEDNDTPPRKRSRSRSAESDSDSVSSISTRSPSPVRRPDDRYRTSRDPSPPTPFRKTLGEKRRRRTSSLSTRGMDEFSGVKKGDGYRQEERNARLRRSSSSPAERGRNHNRARKTRSRSRDGKASPSRTWGHAAPRSPSPYSKRIALTQDGV